MRLLCNAGTSITDIAQQTGFDRRSIKKWLQQTAPAELRPRTLKPCSPIYFQEYLSRRWDEGCVRGRYLLHEIKLRGCTGSFSHLERLLTQWRGAKKKTYRSRHNFHNTASGRRLLSRASLRLHHHCPTWNRP
jgi:hypothetical protein